MKFEDIRSIRTIPDPVLRSVAAPVKEFNEKKMKSLVARMIEIMGEMNGVGIAAPQIGVSQRLFGFNYEDDVLIVVNPLITSVTNDLQWGMEGCLSCPDEQVAIARHVGVELYGQSIHGEEFKYKWTGLPARIIQHEMDHLNGKLILDYKQ